ncbi:MAG: DUF697 domain-containing protein [Nitrosomonadales bacterium]|nr:DUF697 domain-containing protein [Nitrosomonadales bacterium]
MEDTKNTVIRFLVAFASLILLYLLVVFVAGVVQLAEAADRIYHGLGQPVFLGLMSLFVAFVASPLYIYFRFPRALVPPTEASGPEFDKYMYQLRAQLKKNPRLAGVPLASDEDVKSALNKLSKEAEAVIISAAKNVFIGTSISQNGRLDGLITLATQGKMVWKVACIYSQRPSPKQMLYLYSNVATNAFLAESIDDIDLSEVTGPILSSVGIGVLASVPGASVIMNSIASGASNAFLTLRVGCIANQYCESITKPNRSVVRRIATLTAASLVTNIVKENSVQLLASVWNVVAKTSGNAVDAVKSTAGRVADSVSESVNTAGASIRTAVDCTKDAAGKVTCVVSQRVESAGSSISTLLDSAKIMVGVASKDK